MNSSPDIIRELESKRRALNERLMNSKDVAEANSIERELWALRAAIRHHKSRMAKDMPPRLRSRQEPPAVQNSPDSSGNNLSG